MVAESKKKQILGAAIKRFSHFGINKTTMNEVAEDIHMSKANLYYYFPDKTALVGSIIEFILEESEHLVNDIMEKESATLDTLYQFLDVKFQLFEKYYMLFYNLTETANIVAEIGEEVVRRVFDREVANIRAVFKRGISKGELVTFDVQASSELYVSMMRGLAMYCGSCSSNPLLNKDSMQKIVEKQKMATAHFINGIVK